METFNIKKEVSQICQNMLNKMQYCKEFFNMYMHAEINLWCYEDMHKALKSACGKSLFLLYYATMMSYWFCHLQSVWF